MEEFIADTQFTIGFVREKILESEGNEGKIINWSAKHISVGQGFLSKIFKLKLEWEDNGRNLPESVVLKVPTTATILSSFAKIEVKRKVSVTTKAKNVDMIVEMIPLMHRNECNLYDLLRNENIFGIPKSYYEQKITEDEPGIIIMKDFSDISGNVNVADGLTKSQVYQAIEVMASVHAFGMKNPGWEELFETMGKESAFESFENGFKMTADHLEEMKPDYFQGLYDKLAWAADTNYMHESLTLSHVKVGLPAVIVHGDLWSNNLMYRKAPNGTITDELIAVIDWQTAHPGNFAEDIARVLVSSCSAELRRNEWRNLLDFYWDKLTEKLGEQPPGFTKDKLEKAYEIMLPFAAIFFVFSCPMMVDSPVVAGKDKEIKVEEMLYRAKCIVDDVVELKNV